MADLENLYDHKRNTQVLVNGHTYKVDENGVAKGVKKKDAAKLLQGKGWRLWDGQTLKERAHARRAAKRASTGMGLLRADGSSVELSDIPEDDESTNAPDSGDKPTGEGEEGEGNEDDEDLSDDPPVPGEGEEWPDPTDEMSMAYLQAMADAYEVKYAKNIGQTTLIERLKESMYD